MELLVEGRVVGADGQLGPAFLGPVDKHITVSRPPDPPLLPTPPAPPPRPCSILPPPFPPAPHGGPAALAD